MSARVSREAALWALVMVAAGLLRFLSLGWPPLTDAEAAVALSAASGSAAGSHFWLPTSEALAASPAYHTLTRMLFGLVGAWDGGARFFPALAGVLIALLPFGLRGSWGRTAALSAAAAMAVSPSLVAISRTAGGGAIALLGVGGWLVLTRASSAAAAGDREWIGAGILGGLALTAGPALWTAALILGIGWVISRLLGWHDGEETLAQSAARVRRPAVVAAVVALAVASGLAWRPEGVAAVFDSLGLWLSGWRSLAGLPPLTWLMTIPLYETLLFTFGLWGAIGGLVRHDRAANRLTAWALAGVLVILAYPGRQAQDLIWLTMPLAGLAGLAIRDIVARAAEAWSWAGHGLLVAALLLMGLFGTYQLSAYAAGRGPALSPLNPTLSLVLVLAVVGLALVTVVLFALGWSAEVAWTSAGVAGLVMAALVGVSTVWDLSLGASAASAGTLWRPQASTPGTTMLVRTLEGIAAARTGRSDDLPVSLAGELPEGLAWALRRFPRGAEPTGETPPEVVLAPEGSVPADLPAEYLGQVIETGEHWGWLGPLPPLELVSGGDSEAPALSERWVLLVRADVATFGTLVEGLPITP